MQEQMIQAGSSDCDIIHFPEGSLSGYVGVDFPSFKDYDWPELKSATREIQQLAAKLGIWVILGSVHPLSLYNKPHNSLYILNNKGEIEDRYDKRFCAGDDTCNNEELLHFSPGDHPSIFEVKGVLCSVLICHEYRYPELYRSLVKAGVEVVFHSYHAGNMDHERKDFMESQVGEEYFSLNPGQTIPEITMPSTMISYAANNYIWISCSNTSAADSCWSSFMLRPDGVTIGKLEKNEAGLLISEIDTEEQFYDSTLHWRLRSIEGKYFSGHQVNDPRSKDRKSL